MDIFGGIEKLINEHGSAAILKERLDLVADRYSDLEQKLSESILKQKDLELENLKLQNQVRALEKKLNDHHPADRVLSFICYNPEASVSEIADGVGLTVATVKHWIDFHRRNGKTGKLLGRPSIISLIKALLEIPSPTFLLHDDRCFDVAAHRQMSRPIGHLMQ